MLRLFKRALDSGLSKVILYEVILILVQFAETQQVEQYLKDLSKQAGENKDKFYLTIGNILSSPEIGFLNLAIKWFEQGFRFSQNRRTKGVCLANIGVMFTYKDEHDRSIGYYKKALKLEPKSIRTLHNLAASYAFILDFPNALKTSKQILTILEEGNHSEAVQRIEQLAYEFFKDMNQSRINFNKLPLDATTIRTTLRTVEKQLLYFSQIAKEEEIDASSIISGYSKCLETLLHTEITLPYLREKGTIPHEIWKKLRTPLKSVVIYKGDKSLTPGQWAHILKHKDVSDVLGQSLIEYMTQTQPSNVFSTIKKACSVIAGIRYTRTRHNMTLSLKEALKARPKFIEAFNELIDLFY